VNGRPSGPTASLLRRRHGQIHIYRLTESHRSNGLQCVFEPKSVEANFYNAHNTRAIRNFTLATRMPLPRRHIVSRGLFPQSADHGIDFEEFIMASTRTVVSNAAR
jgi:hypothetical protein